jgi:hypothetical protein
VGGLLGAVALFVAPPLAREVLGWGLAVALVVGVRRDTNSRAAMTVPILLALGGGSLAAFRDRLLPFPDAAGLIAEARGMGERAKHLEPSLARPLVRVTLETEHRALRANAGFAAGLGTLDGYAFPQRRFVALVRALRGEPYSPNALVLRFSEAYPPSRVLFQLYNVGFALDGPDEWPAIRGRGPTAGAAWFPTAVVEDKAMEDLAAGLLRWGDVTHAEARRTLRILGADDATRGLSATIAPECQGSEVGPLEREAEVLTLAVKTAAACPLVVATNYAEALQAWGAAAGGLRTKLRTFPAYGALLGVVVPGGTTLVEVGPRPWPPRWTWTAATLGLGLAIAALGLRDGS